MWIPSLLVCRIPSHASYHVQRSFEAVIKGGIFGVGLGQADTKLTGLPFAPTDSIFAVVAEELGLFGSVLLMSLYAVLVWRGLVIARRAPDMLGTLLASGVTFWIGMEALINMAVMVGLMPFAGNALPFISAGGSNLVSTLSADWHYAEHLSSEWRECQRRKKTIGGHSVRLLICAGGTGGGVYPALAVHERTHV